MGRARSIGIIMDGNRRFAKSKGLTSLDGHREGARRAKEVVRWALEEGSITDLCFYTLSTENWSRSQHEIEYLLLLIELFFRAQTDELEKEGVRIRIIGQRERFSPKLRKLFDEVESRTRKNTALTVWFALSYGGRAEILEGILTLQREKIIPTEETLKAVLWTSELPDPDLIIRTGGEKRLSNFLTWGSVYSELFFSESYWPAFTKEEFNEILNVYEARERRKGV